MRLPILIAALAFGLPAAALAEDFSQYSQLFISPMGEPFRAKDGQPYPSALWFAAADANHDGVISRAEFRADAMRFFKALDVNGDGRLTDAEVQRYEYQVAPEVVLAAVDNTNDRQLTDQKGDPVQRTLAKVRQGASFYGVLDSPEPVRAADGDFNMKVTQDEWMAAADRRFGLLRPESKDGISFADLPQTPFQTQYDKAHPKR